MRNPPTWKFVLAMAIVYVVWGSTYLGIRIAVETIPPFMMAGLRQFTAGVLMYVWLRYRGARRPERIHWRSATIVGALMLLVGNGGVAWAERVVPSGLTALLIATTPVWFVLLEWLWHGGGRPGRRIIIGLVLGFVGAGLLVAPGQFAGGTHVDTAGAAVLTIATIGWAVGTMYSRRAKLPASALLGAAMEMATGGATLLVGSLIFGEWHGFAWSAVSTRSWIALGYLTVFGSMVAYTAYMWLMQVSTPARVSTNAFVNPIVAVALGWWLADEPVTPRIAIAAVIIVVAVVLIILHPTKPIAETP